jgi:hypothetical protein
MVKYKSLKEVILNLDTLVKAPENSFIDFLKSKETQDYRRKNHQKGFGQITAIYFIPKRYKIPVVELVLTKDSVKSIDIISYLNEGDWRFVGTDCSIPYTKLKCFDRRLIWQK